MGIQPYLGRHASRPLNATDWVLSYLHDEKSVLVAAAATVLAVQYAKRVKDIFLDPHYGEAHSSPSPASTPAPSHASILHRTWDWLHHAAEHIRHPFHSHGNSPVQVKEATPSSAPLSPELTQASENFAHALYGTGSLIGRIQQRMQEQNSAVDADASMTPEQKTSKKAALDQQYMPVLKPLMAAWPKMETLLKELNPSQEIEAGPVQRRFFESQLNDLVNAASQLVQGLPDNDSRKGDAETVLKTVQGARASSTMTDSELAVQQKALALRIDMQRALQGKSISAQELSAMDVPAGFDVSSLAQAKEEYLTQLNNTLPGKLDSLRSVRDQLRKDVLIVETFLGEDWAKPLTQAFQALGGKGNPTYQPGPHGEDEALDGVTPFKDRLNRAVTALEQLRAKAKPAEKTRIDKALAPLKAFSTPAP